VLLPVQGNFSKKYWQAKIKTENACTVNFNEETDNMNAEIRHTNETAVLARETSIRKIFINRLL
jgi:hypothetical protein